LDALNRIEQEWMTIVAETSQQEENLQQKARFDLQIYKELKLEVRKYGKINQLET
jgi:hypothetical protein